MSSLSVPNFRPIRARVRVLWRILRSVRNEEKKRNFARSYLGNGWSDFLQNWFVNSPHWPANLVPIGLGITELHRCENWVFFLPVNILTVWRAGFLGRTTHHRVS